HRLRRRRAQRDPPGRALDGHRKRRQGGRREAGHRQHRPAGVRRGLGAEVLIPPPGPHRPPPMRRRRPRPRRRLSSGAATISAMRIPLLVVLLCLLAAPAHAWGPRGHRLVGHLAESALTPAARAQVDALLRGVEDEQDRSLAGISTWADELRERDPDLGRRSARWHYVNIGENNCSYEPARDCPGGDCVIEAINDQAAILADRDRSDAKRLQALKF